MEPLTILRDYGWIGVVLLWLAPKVWSFFAERLYPQRVKEKEREQTRRDEETRAEREARATLLRSQIERENREADKRLRLEERMVTALEQMSLGIVAGNERISALIASHTQHANFQFGAHIEVKERLDDIQQMIIYREKVDELEKELHNTQQRIPVIKKEDADAKNNN